MVRNGVALVQYSSIKKVGESLFFVPMLRGKSNPRCVSDGGEKRYSFSGALRTVEACVKR